jgi:predicted GNAT superfamily acetyltransferase
MTSGTTGRAHLVHEAWRTADAAAAKAGVEVRVLDAVADLEAVRRLYEQIWRTGKANPPVTADMLRALATAGSYVSGAYLNDELVGACFGFFSAPARDALHSHIAGVLDRSQARHVGFALKVHQRAWTLEAGAATITWTYDPLVRRNAWFNLGKLAAEAVEYLPDFYGPMDDDINRGDPTDRLLVQWPLTAPTVAAACVGRPRDAGIAVREAVIALEQSASGGPIVRAPAAPVVLVGIPEDIEELRRHEPACAAEWRSALREVLGGLLAVDARVRGVDRRGWYVVERAY